MLMDDGVIVTQHSPWQVDTARLADLRVPTTLTGVLQARLDSLAPMEKGILQRASIFGRVFWDQAVQALLDQPPTADSVSPDWHEILEESLHHLRRRELILHHETSTIEQAAEFTFKHALLRDVTYERVLKRERRIYHARAARWLAEATQRIGRGDEYAAIIAAHHEQAGETSQAADWYQRAGVQAATQFANAEAIRCLTRALELTPETETAARYDLLRAREKVYDLMGDRQNQAQELDQLTALADQLGDDRRRAEAALRRAVYNQQITDFQGCIEAAKQAISLSQSPDTAQTAAEAQLQWGVALIRLADYVAARPHIEDALALSRAGHWANVEAESLRSFNLIAYQQGDYDAARAYSHQALNISRRTGDRRGEIRALNAIATSENLLGNYDMARDYLEQALHISREIGDRYWEAILLSNLGVTAFFTGDYAVSRQFHSEAQHKYHEVRHWLGESVAIGNIGDASFQMGDYAAARAFHEEALRTRRALGDRVGEAHMLVWLGKYARLDRDEETARNYFQQALDLASSINARHEQATTLQALANWHADHEQWAEAATFYQQALDLRRATHQSRLSLEPLAGLARVALAQGEIPQALEYAEQIMNQSSEIKPDNLFEPVWVYLMCYRVLKAAQDARYTILLKDTYAMLQHMAERLGEEDLKHGFLTNIATHRDLLAEWAQR